MERDFKTLGERILEATRAAVAAHLINDAVTNTGKLKVRLKAQGTGSAGAGIHIRRSAQRKLAARKRTVCDLASFTRFTSAR